MQAISFENLQDFSEELKAKYALKDEVLELRGESSDSSNKVTVYGAKKAAKEALDTANRKIATLTEGNKGISISGSSTDPTIALQLSNDSTNELVIKENNGFEGLYFKQDEYALAQIDANSGMSASYQMTKNGVKFGAVIDIPKDMFVTGGKVETYSTAGVYGAAGCYLVLTLANATSDKVYIPVGALIEYVTSGSSSTDSIVVTVNPTTHKVTATITDNSISIQKLSSDVQKTLSYVGNKSVADQIDEKINNLSLGTVYVKNDDVQVVTKEQIVALLA